MLVPVRIAQKEDNMPKPVPVLVLRGVGLKTFLGGADQPRMARLVGEQIDVLQRLFGLSDQLLRDTSTFHFEIKADYVRIYFSNGTSVARLSVSQDDEDPVTVIFVDRPRFKTRFLQLGAQEAPADEWPPRWVIAAYRMDEE